MQTTVEVSREAEDCASVCMQIATRSPEWPRIKLLLEQDLTRLTASRTQDFRVIPVGQVLGIALATEREGIRGISRSLGVDRSSIQRCRRVTGTVIAGILYREGLISKLPSDIDQDKYGQLKRLHKEADLIGSIIGKPETKKQLEQIPELNAALWSFIDYSTIEPFLAENQLSCKPGDIARINYNVRGYLFDKNFSSIGPLLRKVTFSRLIHGQTNWYGATKTDIDETLNRSAEFVCKITPPGGKKNTACQIRSFLREIMAQELRLAQRDIRFGLSYALGDMFVSINGSGIEEVRDIDLSKTFGQFKDVAYLPLALEHLVRAYIAISDTPQTSRCLAEKMYEDLPYSLVYKEALINAGFMFLENALRLKPKKLPTWDLLTLNRGEAVQRVRKTFQSYLPVSSRP